MLSQSQDTKLHLSTTTVTGTGNSDHKLTGEAPIEHFRGEPTGNCQRFPHPHRRHTLHHGHGTKAPDVPWRTYSGDQTDFLLDKGGPHSVQSEAGGCSRSMIRDDGICTVSLLLPAATLAPIPPDCVKSTSPVTENHKKWLRKLQELHHDQ